MRTFRRTEGYREEELIRAAIDHLEAAQRSFSTRIQVGSIRQATSATLGLSSY